MGIRLGSQFNSNDNTQKPRKVICNGKYLVLSTLGSGATGKVKLGYDLQNNNTVALKLMAVRPASTRQAGQIQREIKAMTIIKNPYVLALRHVDMDCKYPKGDGSIKQCILLAIELAGGGELFDYMMYTGAFSESIGKVYTRQLLEALAACHKQGVYHRDLKPENLLLDDNFTLKVADFGYSAIQNSNANGDQLLHTECGTRSYMAPEVLAHQAYDGTAVDTWSAAVVIFIMLTGNPPMQLATKSDWWFNCLTNGNVERFWKAHMRACPDLSVGARNFINRMLVPDSNMRASLDEMLNDPWLTGRGDQSEMGGRACDTSTLMREMDDRKRKVDSAKQAEKEKVKLAALQAKIAAETKGTFDPFQQQQQVRRSAAAAANSSPLKKKSAAPPKDDGVTVGVITKIYLPEGFGVTASTPVSEDLLTAALNGVADAIKTLDAGNTVAVDTGKNKIKCTSKVDGVETSFLVKLEVEDDEYIVASVSRRGGDMFAFRKVFGLVNSKITGAGGNGSGEEKEVIVDGQGPIDMM